MRDILSGIYMMAVISTACLMSFFTTEIFAQELSCDVEINSSSVDASSRNVFQTLQQEISDYMNETKWTDAQFQPNERVECRLFLKVTDYSDYRVRGELQIQLLRPVFNSTYTTTLFNFKDSKVEFDYHEGDRIVFNDKVWESNLSSILNYYAYLLLALDFDSFSYLGGEKYFDKAASIVQAAQTSGEIGWRIFEDSKNRSAVLNSFTDPNTSSIRELNYLYHRKGLDEMASNPEKGRGQITETMDIISELWAKSPMSVALSIFRDAKLDELVNIYSKASGSEREKVYERLYPVYPSEVERLEKIKTPEDI